MPPKANLPKPAWIIRTYAGFGDAAASNQRFRDNLARGQTGLSVAFDLPTQCGYDADHPQAAGEVGLTGVSVSHLGDMRALFDGIDLATANTSMTINATAPWLYALYLALADERGVPRDKLRGTTQNDLLKEFVARGTYVFDPEASLRLSADLVAQAARLSPRWNPVNCCGYHLMESGARPEEEVGYAIAGGLLLLDQVRQNLSQEAFARVVEAISFFVNSGLELVPEIAKIRVYAQLWPTLCEERYGVRPRFRAGCQVRSLTLTAQQPEVNLIRIALEALPVILSADARVGALQLPGFREALGLPDAGEQTLALRTQQVLMYETGVADWPDLFAGSHVIEGEMARQAAEVRKIVHECLELGYARTIDRLARLLGLRIAEWRAAIETGARPLVGVNCFEEAVPVAAASRAEPVHAHVEQTTAARAAALKAWRAQRNPTDWQAARQALIEAARGGHSVVEPSVDFAKAGGTTGEWTEALLEVFGHRYAAPLGVDGAMLIGPKLSSEAVAAPADGRKLRVLLAKAGLDGHVNALRVLAVALRQAGAEVVYLGLGQSPAGVAAAAVAEDVDVIGISALSGSHLAFCRQLQAELQARGGQAIPVVVGGIVPPDDRPTLAELGVQRVFGVEDGPIGLAVEAILALARDVTVQG